jgi:hypothetical protein
MKYNRLAFNVVVIFENLISVDRYSVLIKRLVVETLSAAKIRHSYLKQILPVKERYLG